MGYSMMNAKRNPKPAKPAGPKYAWTDMNRSRAGWAERACDAFGGETGQKMLHEPEEIIGDLLADLMHLCHQRKLDFEKLLTHGRSHFDIERTGREE